MKSLLKIFLVVAIYFISIANEAQSFRPRLGNIGAAEGLSQSSVYAIAQDNYGFMWFGTQDGLNRYDGYNIKVFKNNPGDTTTIADDIILSLANDNEGNLWIGTMRNGISKYVIKEDKFYHYKHEEENNHSLSENFINRLYCDSYGNMWIGTFNRGVNVISSKDNKLYRIVLPGQSTDEKSHTEVWKFKEDKNNNLWLGTSLGLYKYPLNKLTGEPQADDFKSFTNNKIKNNIIHGIEIIDDDNLLLGYWGSGLYTFNISSNKISELNLNEFEENKNLFIQVTDILKENKNKYWVSTNDIGTYLINMSEKSITQYAEGSNLTLEKDNSGILWIGGYSDGVITYDKKVNQFKLIYDDPTRDDDISGKDVTSILEDKDGEVWVGTYYSGITRYNNNMEFKKIYSSSNSSQKGLNDDRIMAITQTNDGLIWVCTDNGGLYSFDKTSERFKNYRYNPGKPNSLSSDQLSTIYKDSKGNLWIGTGWGILEKMNRKNGTFKHYLDDKGNSIIPGLSINCIEEDENGNLLIGTMEGGLSLFNPVTEEVKTYHPGNSAENEIEGKSVNHSTIITILPDKDGVFWLGTAGGGLNRYDSRSGVFTYYGMKEGLPNDYVYAILDDNNGSLWLSTNKGLASFNKADKNVTVYSVLDGLQGNEFSQGAYAKGKKGRMYFGGINGFNFFMPNEIESNSYVPPVYFTNFKVFDEKLESGTPEFVNSKLNLDYSQNYFSFEFVALNYTASIENNFAYKLEGFDNNWHYIDSKRRYGSYTNLDPGGYKLLLKGSNNDNLWNNEPKVIELNIQPPYWMTWWFRTLFVLIVVSVVYYVFNQRIKILKQEKEFQQKVSQTLIQSQETERGRIAQEMHDSLGQDMLLIKNRSMMSLQDNSLTERVLEHLTQISELSSKVLKSVRQISHNLRPPELDRLGLTETIKSILSGLRESSEMKVTGEIDDIDELLPKEMQINIVRIVQESLTNIVKHSKAKMCNLLVVHNDNLLEVTISDDGIGFNSSNLGDKKLTGLGLTGIKERVNILNGSFELKTSPGNGTKIKISIPLNT